MRKIQLIFIALLFSSFGSYAQNGKLDSLHRIIKTATDPKVKVKILGRLSYEYLNINPEKSLKYSKEALGLAKSIKDPYSISVAYLYFGLYYEVISDYQKSLSYSFKALKIADEINNGELIENLYNNIALVYLDMENYPSALEYLKKRLTKSQLDKTDQLVELAPTYTNLGVVYLRLEDFEKARDAFQKAMELDVKAKDTVSLILNYNNLACVFIEEKNFSNALKYCETGYPLAVRLEQKALQVELLKTRAEIHKAFSEFQESKALLLKGEKIAKELNSTQLLVDLNEQLMELENAQGNYKSALAYSDRYHYLKDSLISIEKNKQILIIEAQYKSNYKEQENKILKAQNEKKQIQLEIQYAFIAAGFMVFLLTVWICIVIYRSKKKEEKSNQLLKNQQLAIQDKNEQLNKLYEEIMVQNDSIQEQYKMLDQLNNVKNQLFSVISHDVRSPLNSIKGALDLFEKGYLETEEIKEMAGRLKIKVQNTSALLDNLLQWSRSQMEGIKVNSVKVDLQQIAEQNYQLYAPIAEEKGVKLENHIVEPVHAFADPEMIMTVVRNLLGNALKFTEANGKVSLHAENQLDHIVFSVKDSGVGMSSEQSKMIFNENHLSTPGTNFETGTGLGLLLCKEFVDRNGGRIWVESRIKKGSSFYFSLPKAIEEAI